MTAASILLFQSWAHWPKVFVGMPNSDVISDSELFCSSSSFLLYDPNKRYRRPCGMPESASLDTILGGYLNCQSPVGRLSNIEKSSPESKFVPDTVHLLDLQDKECLISR
jgi:hypothetical protein